MLDILQWLSAIKYLWLSLSIKSFLNLFLPTEINHYVSVTKLLSLSAPNLSYFYSLLCHAEAGTLYTTFLLSQECPCWALPTGGAREHAQLVEGEGTWTCSSLLVHAGFLILSGSPLPYFTQATAVESKEAVESSFRFTNAGRISLVQLPQRHTSIRQAVPPPR